MNRSSSRSSSTSDGSRTAVVLAAEVEIVSKWSPSSNRSSQRSSHSRSHSHSSGEVNASKNWQAAGEKHFR